jgi:acyl carrier protein
MSQLKEELRALISEIAEVNTIPDDADFNHLGIDSMMGVEIVAAIERRYHIKVPNEELLGVSSLNKSYEMVLSKLPEDERARFVA